MNGMIDLCYIGLPDEQLPFFYLIVSFNLGVIKKSIYLFLC